MRLISPFRLARKATRLGWRGAVDMAVAQRALLRARRALRTRPRGALLRPASGSPRPPATPPGVVDALERMAVAVRRASDYGVFAPTCLVRALALEELARREGAPEAVVRVGVRQTGGAFEAHAWLELGDRVVGDTRENVDRFTVLEDFSGLPA